MPSRRLRPRPLPPTSYDRSPRFLYDIAVALKQYEPRLQPGHDDPPAALTICDLPGRLAREIALTGKDMSELLLQCGLPRYHATVTDQHGDTWALDWRRHSPTEEQMAERARHKFNPEAWTR